MRLPSSTTASVTLLSVVLGCHSAGALPPPDTVTSATQRSEKDTRTPAQQKINSQLLYEIYRRRGEAERRRIPPGPTGVRVDTKDRALIDVRAEVTPALQKKIAALSGSIVSTSREYRSIIAWVPLLNIERLAEETSVRAIEPAAEATTKDDRRLQTATPNNRGSPWARRAIRSIPAPSDSFIERAAQRQSSSQQLE